MIAIIILLIAFGRLPYGYYTFVRIFICGVSVYSAFLLMKKDSNYLGWLFIIIGILYNPIIPIYLTREIWQYLNIITATIFIVKIFR